MILMYIFIWMTRPITIDADHAKGVTTEDKHVADWQANEVVGCIDAPHLQLCVPLLLSHTLTSGR